MPQKNRGQEKLRVHSACKHDKLSPTAVVLPKKKYSQQLLGCLVSTIRNAVGALFLDEDLDEYTPVKAEGLMAMQAMQICFRFRMRHEWLMVCEQGHVSNSMTHRFFSLKIVR